MCFDKEAGMVTIAFPDLRELTVWWESRYTEDREMGVWLVLRVVEHGEAQEAP